MRNPRTAKFFRPCRSLRVGDRIDQFGRDAQILQVEIGNLQVACLLRFEDNGEESMRYYSYIWGKDDLIARYEEPAP